VLGVVCWTGAKTNATPLAVPLLALRARIILITLLASQVPFIAFYFLFASISVRNCGYLTPLRKCGD
jgi:hypothetical protein